MTNIFLTQSEAEHLLFAVEKIKVDDTEYEFPMLGGSLEIPLLSRDRKENFLLDISRGRIDLSKVKYQSRVHKIVVLARLDMQGAPHMNPDGAEIKCPHIHLYREGYGDRWAFELSLDRFTDSTNVWQTLEDFMDYCNIVEDPHIKRGLFV